MTRSGRTVGLLCILASGAAALRGLQPPLHSPDQGIHGCVIDADGPVSGATVRIKGESHSVVTDTAGNFHIPLVAPGSRIVAAKEGYLIAGANARDGQATIHLLRYADDVFLGYQWVDPRPDAAAELRCAKCHPETFAEWSRSAHARSATNQRFLNVYDGTDWHGHENRGWNLLAEAPLTKGVCYSCHIPSPPPTIETVEKLSGISGVATLGIHCDFCHKIDEVRTAEVGLSHGRFAMRHVLPSRGQVFLGPLGDVDRGENAWSPVYRQSAYCAGCHEGTMFGIAAYTTYSEWRESDYARRGVQCQNCHMAATGQRTTLAIGEGAIARDPATISNHAFPSGEPEALRNALSIDLSVEPHDKNWKVTTQVRAGNVGHFMPTGHPSRQLILIVQCVNATGEPLRLESGLTLPEAADDLAGRPGRLYAKTLVGEDGELDVPVWRAERIASDTRLAPDAADRRTFVFTGAPPAQITAELVYRRFSKSVADEKSWPENELVVARKQWPHDR